MTRSSCNRKNLWVVGLRWLRQEAGFVQLASYSNFVRSFGAATFAVSVAVLATLARPGLRYAEAAGTERSRRL